jgi:SAM-dependent methyltransferase
MPRVLRRLSEDNETWLIDRYEGRGRGVRVVPRLPGITLIQGYMGEFIQKLPQDYFDYVFSVSVVEHVPLNGLESFFADCARVLKPSGRMFHAIDTYLFDSDCEELSQPFRERLHAYLQFAERPDLSIRLAEGEARIDEQIRFSCAYATQPDNVLHEWHLYRPQEKRLRGQVVSIKSAWEKVALASQGPS